MKHKFDQNEQTLSKQNYETLKIPLAAEKSEIK
jgi:hypothetical protein